MFSFDMYYSCFKTGLELTFLQINILFPENCLLCNKLQKLQIKPTQKENKCLIIRFHKADRKNYFDCIFFRIFPSKLSNYSWVHWWTIQYFRSYCYTTILEKICTAAGPESLEDYFKKDICTFGLKRGTEYLIRRY